MSRISTPSVVVSLHPARVVAVQVITKDSRAVIQFGGYPTQVDVFVDLDELAHTVKVITEAYERLCAEVAARALDSGVPEVDR